MLRNRVRELHWLLGKTMLEAEILKEALDAIAGPTTAAVLAVLAEERFTISGY